MGPKYALLQRTEVQTEVHPETLTNHKNYTLPENYETEHAHAQDYETEHTHAQDQ